MEFIMKVVAIVQARMGSSRFPKKVMADIVGIPMIELLLMRLKKSKNIDQIVVATSSCEQNRLLIEHVKKRGFDVFQGSEDDVLDRFYQTAIFHQADIVVRITGDCPLIDADVVDLVISEFKSNNVDYASNINPPTYPDGLDVEVFSYLALERTWKLAQQFSEREHVTPFIRSSGKFRTINVANSVDKSEERWTVDEKEDLEVITGVFSYFSPRVDFSWEEVIQLTESNPDLFLLNKHFPRNYGGGKNTGQKLWKRAKRVIPGGNMLLSKRPEMFLPDHWPTYFSKAAGCKIWDMDGAEYIDMSIMGVGTNILGYGHSEVDGAVLEAVQLGNMSTFNCPEEVYLAEKLIEMHPWADMVKFARSGGEANAIAIRIARAASGKDKVAICGYHGWHDWYLSANLVGDDSLEGHLLSGLDPKGVPHNLINTVFPFSYNNFPELEALVQEHDIGVIKMEVQRNEPPRDNFLEKVRSLAIEKGIVLVFDECTSGFRETFGGLHKKYGIEPDIAVFGKGLGNGYAVTAVIGCREVMEAAQSTFISSTFWTERIGSVAALKTLEVMQREQSWSRITNTGLEIKDRLQQLADKHEVEISLWGLPSLPGFSIKSENMLAYKTLITQEMLVKGFLATNSIYVCTEHTSDILDGFFESLNHVFGLIKDCEEGRDVKSLLKGPVCHDGFQRLN